MKQNTPPPLDAEAIQAQAALEKQRHNQRMAWMFAFLLAVPVLALFVPLGVFLVRLAMGQ